ncbi:hypothetical protein [Bacteroides oleiciplenus]|uniref:hypothetical protein n=1 Tax=Bacteroides oleiciplenus TaxID=626931 RepID=UPI0026DB796A|nr:hypothetical protein [Bacteroides oleiciplenus]
MGKNVEMISLNSTRTEFNVEMNLDERLQRLESDELKSIKAGATCPKKQVCPRYTCPDRCDSYCEPDCVIDCWDCFDYGCDFGCNDTNEDCRVMDPT